MKIRMYWTIGRGVLCGLLALLAFSFMALPGAAAPRPSAPDFAAIDAYVEGERQAARVPGLALGIVHGDQIVHLKGFGIAEPSGRPITAQTPFIIGSTTKSMTAVAIMQLVEAGKVELDAPTNGLPTVRHVGVTANFHANLVLVPESRWGIVLLMNGNSAFLGKSRIDGIATAT